MVLRSLSIGWVVVLAACSTPKPSRVSPRTNPYLCTYQAAGVGGAFYQDDGPGHSMPDNMDSVLEPIPIAEPLHRFANRPYTVLGKNYIPRTQAEGIVQEGIGSWYGRKFHGQKTSSGEPYNMYAMTAAHPTLPIPSYVRVTNQTNGRSVVVRINDRGPFHRDRVIDLSFLAACRLNYAMNGSAPVKVETLLPGQHRHAASQTKMVVQNISQANPTNPRIIPPAVGALTTIPLIALPKGGVFIQLGAFSAQSNAESFRLKVAETLNQPVEHIYLHHTGSMVRVRMGPFKDKDTAIKEAERLTGEHQLQALLVH